MRLTKTDIAILRRIGAHTEADSLQALGSPGSYPFWRSQYRAYRLCKLETAGYVNARYAEVEVSDDLVDITRRVGLLLPNGKRRTSFYALTDSGGTALREWQERPQPRRRWRGWQGWFGLFRHPHPTPV